MFCKSACLNVTEVIDERDGRGIEQNEGGRTGNHVERPGHPLGHAIQVATVANETINCIEAIKSHHQRVLQCVRAVSRTTE